MRSWRSSSSSDTCSRPTCSGARASRTGAPPWWSSRRAQPAAPRPAPPMRPAQRQRSRPPRHAWAASAPPAYQGNPQGGTLGQAAEPRRARTLRRAGGAGGARRRPEESPAGRRLPGRAGCGRLVCLSPSRRPHGARERPAVARDRRREPRSTARARTCVFAQGPQRSAGDDRRATAGDAGCGASSSRSFRIGTPSGSRRPRHWPPRTRTRPKSASTWHGPWLRLRRQNGKHALAADFPQLKSIAMTFYENLAQLRKHSDRGLLRLDIAGRGKPRHRLPDAERHARRASAGATDGRVRSDRGRAQNGAHLSGAAARPTTTLSRPILPSAAGADADLQLFTDAAGSGPRLSRKGVPAGARLVRSPFRHQGPGHAAAVAGGDHKTRGRRLIVPTCGRGRLNGSHEAHRGAKIFAPFPSPESCPVRAVCGRRACRRPVAAGTGADCSGQSAAPRRARERARQGSKCRVARLVFFFAAARMSRISGVARKSSPQSAFPRFPQLPKQTRASRTPRALG